MSDQMSGAAPPPDALYFEELPPAPGTHLRPDRESTVAIDGWESVAALRAAYVDTLRELEATEAERDGVRAEADGIAQILNAVAEHDLRDDIYWTSSGPGYPLKFFVMCSDVFWWGSSDGEELTPETLPAWLAAVADVRKIDRDAVWSASELYAARRRGMRPQGAAYPLDRRLWPLFDAAGPEREVGMGNPRKHPADDPDRRVCRPIEDPEAAIKELRKVTAERDGLAQAYEHTERESEQRGEALRAMTAERDRIAGTVEAIRGLTRDTDGDTLDPDVDIPVGELLRVLGEAGALEAGRD